MTLQVEVLYTIGCPGYERALSLVREVLREEEAEADLTVCRVRTPEEAEARRFPGSPTIRVAGQDVDTAAGDVAGFCCRAYVQPDGSLAPVPPRAAIETAVRTALGRPAEGMAGQDIGTLPLGVAAPDFSLRATDGKRYSLASFSAQPYLAVAFLANHCPYTAAWEGRLVALARRYGRKGVAFAAISSSDVKRFPADTPAHMAERAKDRRFPFPYLYDGKQAAARAFGATHTPHVFLFDRERLLHYRGAVDSDWENRPGTEAYLEAAIQALVEDRRIDVPVTRPVGLRLRLRD